MVVGGRELIDTLWNVNKNTMELKEIESIELIDTLWNVNEKEGKYDSRRKKELIDTLWNVNELPTLGEIVGRLGINRYIMECK